MNRERIGELADVIEALPYHAFSMEIWAVDKDGLTLVMATTAAECGTAGCLAGWTCMHFKNEAKKSRLNSIQGAAAIVLDLEDHEATMLFRGWWHPGFAKERAARPFVTGYYEINKDEAVAELRRLANGGDYAAIP